MEKIWGLVNPSDVLTKPHSIDRLEEVITQFGGRVQKRKWSSARPCKMRWADVVDSEEEEGGYGDEATGVEWCGFEARGG